MTRLASENQNNLSHSPKRLAVSKIVFGGWSAWFLQQVINTFYNYAYVRGMAEPKLHDFVWPVAGAVTVGLGWWLSWRLFRNPKRSTANWFALVCGILLWKAYVGVILFLMHPAFGGHSFVGAVGEWWNRSTGSILIAFGTFSRLLLLLFSIGFWSSICFNRSHRQPPSIATGENTAK